MGPDSGDERPQGDAGFLGREEVGLEGRLGADGLADAIGAYGAIVDAPGEDDDADGGGDQAAPDSPESPDTPDTPNLDTP